MAKKKSKKTKAKKNLLEACGKADALLKEKKAKTSVFRVYFRQVNQSFYSILAPNREKAIEAACNKWRKDNSYPEVVSVETNGVPDNYDHY